jgi:hypothetical protein
MSLAKVAYSSVFEESNSLIVNSSDLEETVIFLWDLKGQLEEGP